MLNSGLTLTINIPLLPLHNMNRMACTMSIATNHYIKFTLRPGVFDCGKRQNACRITY